VAMDEKIIPVDIAIIGGGIAGLWALNRLRNLGYQAILLESNALGGGQTIKSQGIIHGGIKYALTGILTGSSNAVKTMPQRWKDCLSGTGEIDLHKVNRLANEQLLWSTGGLGSEIASFFASKTLSSRVQKLTREQYPIILQQAAFKGQAYRLEEVVLDVFSLITELADSEKDHIFKINSTRGCEFVFQANDPKTISSLKINSGSDTFTIQAKRYLLTAGEGNETLASHLFNPPAMQRRPLQMVFVKFKTNYPLFAHCIEAGMNPRITITTHLGNDGKTVWYLGGQIAEDGIHRTPTEQCIAAKKELNALFPWLDLTHATWHSFFINRAESAQPGGKRPDTECVQTSGNTLVAWPTKLVLSPLLTDNIVRFLREQGIMPSFNKEKILALESLEKPTVASLPWNETVS
jgi:glycerol-3-phosphate dehydrogenase